MPQVAHLALENGRSSKADMTLWLEAHRPKSGKLDGDAGIEREALANLETSDVFRAVTTPLRMGGGRQGELMLDEFRRGAARYGRLRNAPLAGIRYLRKVVGNGRFVYLTRPCRVGIPCRCGGLAGP